MKLFITGKTTVRDIVAKYSQTRAVFEKYGIDYCCGGGQTVEKALQGKGMTLESLAAELNDALVAHAGAPSKDWSEAFPAELADYIEERHHTFMKAQLPRLRNMLAAVQRAHAARHGEMLEELRNIYDSLQWEIEQHLMKEEQILFPYIRRIEAFVHGGGEEPVAHCGTIQNPIRQMEREHDNAGHALSRMRDVTFNYRLPEDACNTFRALYEGLQALETDLHEHIHLENNILFPKSVELECAGKTA